MRHAADCKPAPRPARNSAHGAMDAAAACSGAAPEPASGAGDDVLHWGPYVLCAVAVAGLLVGRIPRLARRPVAHEAGGVARVHLGRRSRPARSSPSYGQLVLLGPRAVPARRRAVDPARAARRCSGRGVFAFLAGHVAYSAAFLTQPIDSFGLGAGAVLLAVVVGGVLRWLGSGVAAGHGLAGARLHGRDRPDVRARLRRDGGGRTVGGRGRRARVHCLGRFGGARSLRAPRVPEPRLGAAALLRGAAADRLDPGA